MIMACPAILTGQNFLASVLSGIDCQAQTIGLYGYGALADPTSFISLMLTGLLTLFVALFGIRMMLGYPIAGRDLVNAMLKIGIVLTLATSWPAWRVLGYDLVIHGPDEIARAIGTAAQLPAVGNSLGDRLQRIDDGLVAFIAFGTGRPMVAQSDWFFTQSDWYQIGLTRIVFLSGTVGIMAMIRLAAAILLAIAPLMAGLLLFGTTRSIFAGWAKGLAMTFLASLALTLVLQVEIAMIEPWLQDVLLRRAATQITANAPAEGLAIALSFMIVLLGLILLAGWIAFHPSDWLSIAIPATRLLGEERDAIPLRAAPDHPPRQAAPGRHVSLAIADSLRREERHIEMRDGRTAAQFQLTAIATTTAAPAIRPGNALGTDHRRGGKRVSAASIKRDAAH
ncbi:Type IV secretory pathway, VirB6 component precursor [Sphingobium yanoikuyae]|uniref:Type IV secretory pathway, VirB6 component n=1 Tax=Sphingobium yanoikuyae TaxID=13690 RepID=A0A084EG12_SPHYA|nr:type IV secretion system protein [Sphingobium yanoikuyae]KEZ16904.1 Type IV secretory pathway, VirB6 component precursor [Sphingobium yanoikuyae]